MNLSRTVYKYKSKRDDSIVEDKVLELALKKPTDGQDMIYSKIRLQGLKWNYKRIRRVYLKLNLNKRAKTRKRIPARVKEPLFIPETPNIGWSMDFMHDSLSNGRKFRTLNIIDDYNREVLAIQAYLSIGSKLVTDVLSEVIRENGKPQVIRVDNGPEFISSTLGDWCYERNIKLHFIQPGKPNQNGYVERFNRTYRREILDSYLFDSLDQVRILTEEWINEYNNERPHESLGGLPPAVYRQKNSNFKGREASLPSFEGHLLNKELNEKY
jgi:putative transposase